ncbi:MAG: dihydrofolate reductase [Pseudomonadota bacterium]
MKDAATPITFSAIVARSRNGVIGRDGDLPWRLRSDLRHFKRVTLGKPCLMGRKTWQSLPGALPGRPNLVLSRNAGLDVEGGELATSLDSLVAIGTEHAEWLGVTEVMVIGGEQLYRALLPRTGRIYETIVQTEIEGDAYFPELDSHDWAVRNEVFHAAGKGDDHDFVTRVLERRSFSIASTPDLP